MLWRREKSLASYFNLEVTMLSLKLCKARPAGPCSEQILVIDAWLIKLGEISSETIFIVENKTKETALLQINLHGGDNFQFKRYERKNF
jgi:hypothetical protein